MGFVLLYATNLYHHSKPAISGSYSHIPTVVAENDLSRDFKNALRVMFIRVVLPH